MALRQKQISKITFADLAALTASTLTSPEVAYIVSENAWYTKIASVNTKVNPSVTTASGITNVAAGNIAATNVQTALNELDTEKQSISEKGVANGYASLDGTGKVPAAQLPSYVDDVLEFANLATFPVTGETGKLYTTLDTNKIYRWSGSAYVEVSAFSGVASDISFTATGNIAAVNVQTALVELDDEKQAKVQYQEEGASIGTLGGISTVNFTGIGTASVTGSTLTFNVPTVIASTVTNTPANTIAAVTVQAAIDELSLEKQEKIQLQEEGVSVGTAGQATTFNFVGSNITTSVSGTTATITTTKGFTDNYFQVNPTGVDTVANITPLPLDATKVQISINGLIEKTGITVSAGGVVTVSSGTLGYSIDATDAVEFQYISA
jgi:hypothetical protein